MTTGVALGAHRAMSPRERAATAAVTAVLVLVGVYDIAVGGLLLGSPRPWEVHGAGTGWLGLAGQVGGAPDDATLGLFRRMGAFSLHAGVCTVVWGLAGHGRPGLRTLQFATYLGTGLAFAWTDARFFADTAYLGVKHGIGAVFFLAFLVHVGLRWRDRR